MQQLRNKTLYRLVIEKSTYILRKEQSEHLLSKSEDCDIFSKWYITSRSDITQKRNDCNYMNQTKGQAEHWKQIRNEPLYNVSNTTA